MSLDANIFGLRGDTKTAKSVMDGLDRQAAPSPHNPASVPNDQASLNYQRLYDAAAKLLRLENDPARLLQLQKVREFADEVLSTDSEAMPAQLVTPGPAPAPSAPPMMPPPPNVAAPPPGGGGPPMPGGGGPLPGMPGPGGQ